jgi:hypothetical protein
VEIALKTARFRSGYNVTNRRTDVISTKGVLYIVKTLPMKATDADIVAVITETV